MNCPNCGNIEPDGSAFCNKCGQQLTPAVGAPPRTVMGLAPNITALLAYVFGWVSGLVIFFVEKDRFIRFHAMQSVVLFGGLHVVYQALKIVLSLLSFFDALAIVIFLIYVSLGLTSLVLWVVLMVKAYKGELFRLPVVGDIVERILINTEKR